MTSLGAGCRLLGNFNGSMTGSIDCFGFGLVADRAGVGLDTGIFTGRSGRDLALIPTVALGRDFFLGNEYSIADGAVLAFGQTSLSAGWSLCCIDYFCVAGRRDFFHTGENRITNGALRTGCMTSLGAGCGLLGNFNGSMTGSSDCFCFGFIANRAGVGLDTGIFTSRSGRDLALIPTVALGGDHFLGNEDFVADRAVLTLGQTRLGAGRSLCCIDYFCVAGRFDFSRLGRSAAITLASALFFALFRAGRGNRYCPFAPVMTKLPNYLRLGFATNLTSKFPDTGDCTGGLNLYHALVPAVSQGGNVHVAANFLPARSADGFSCATGLGTGGRLRTGGYRNNLVFMPYAIVDGLIVFDSCPSCSVLRLGVGAVGVVQLGGGDGD